MILPNTDAKGALHIAEKIRHAVESQKVGLKKHVTISLGVAAVTPAPKGNPRALIAQADRMLYKAKRAGKNQVCARFARSFHRVDR